MRVVELRAVRGEAVSVDGEIDSGDLGDVESENEREKTIAAVGVYVVIKERSLRRSRFVICDADVICL